MPDTVTTVVKLTKPEVGASKDTWGNKLNENFDKLEAYNVTDRTANIFGLQTGAAPEDASLQKLDGTSVLLNAEELRVAAKPLYYAGAVTVASDKPKQLVPQDWVKSLIDLALPYGTIMLWVGTETNVPAGWHICDGQGGTPDLRGRFVMAAVRNAEAPGYVNGAQLTVYAGNAAPGTFQHTHVVSTPNYALLKDQIPPHAHGQNLGSNIFIGQNAGGAAMSPSLAIHSTVAEPPLTSYGVTTMTGGIGLGSLGNGTGSAANGHTHPNVASDINNAPGVPWISLFYIMKTSNPLPA